MIFYKLEGCATCGDKVIETYCKFYNENECYDARDYMDFDLRDRAYQLVDIHKQSIKLEAKCYKFVLDEVNGHRNDFGEYKSKYFSTLEHICNYYIIA